MFICTRITNPRHSIKFHNDAAITSPYIVVVNEKKNTIVETLAETTAERKVLKDQ